MRQPSVRFSNTAQNGPHRHFLLTLLLAAGSLGFKRVMSKNNILEGWRASLVQTQVILRTPPPPPPKKKRAKTRFGSGKPQMYHNKNHRVRGCRSSILGSVRLAPNLAHFNNPNRPKNPNSLINSKNPNNPNIPQSTKNPNGPKTSNYPNNPTPRNRKPLNP